MPFSKFFGIVDERLSCPVPATLFVAIIATGLGAIPLGSSTAFLDLTGSFIILTTVSYAIPFMANVLTKRRHFPRGPFYLGKFGTPVNIAAVVLISLFNIFYCFRKSLSLRRERYGRLTSPTSIRHPYYKRRYELQQRHPGRSCRSDWSVVGCTCD